MGEGGGGKRVRGLRISKILKNDISFSSMPTVIFTLRYIVTQSR